MKSITKEKGQFFTTNLELKKTVFSFIKNKPKIILEPSVGRGDLVEFVLKKNPKINFHMYEIDKNIEPLSSIEKKSIFYKDFLKTRVTTRYNTIIGNPPFVKTSTGNLYVKFIEKCYNLLEIKGELIFIIPSDFFKLTQSRKILTTMLNNGTFTHIYHPHNENLFKGASIDVIIFRYSKDKSLPQKTKYNGEELWVLNCDGIVTFQKEFNQNRERMGNYFDIYVGMVSGRESIYKNKNLGNISLLNTKGQLDKYIYIENFPTQDEKLNSYLKEYKNELIKRKIRKFNNSNWFEWGAPRNKKNIEINFNKPCIYVKNMTRNSEIAFVNKVQYFGGSLLLLIPKNNNINLKKIVDYLNSQEFQRNYIYSKRFKIGHRQLSNHLVDFSNFK